MIDKLFSPASIAIVGASPKPESLSSVVMESLRHAGFPGEIFPVNSNYTDIDGLKCYPTIKDINRSIDLALFVLPAEQAIKSLFESSGLVSLAIIIGGGFAESGRAGKLLEVKLKEIIAESGIRVVGPNCLGLFDTVSKVDTFFISPSRVKRPGPGPLSIISQSGSFALTAMDELAYAGIGVARVISYGNKADLDESDFLDFLARDDATGAVALYVESINDGRRFVEAARRCSDKKPVMAVKVGRGEAGLRATASHTGALAGRNELYSAAFRKAGVIELDDYEDFLDGARVLGLMEPACGKRVMIISDGGGFGVFIADKCAELGMDVSALPEEIISKLREKLPPICSINNPMDLTGSVIDDWFVDAVNIAMESGLYDLVIVAPLWGPPGLSDALPSKLAEARDKTGKPMIICSPGGEVAIEKNRLYKEAGFNIFNTPESAARAARIISGVKNK